MSMVDLRINVDDDDVVDNSDVKVSLGHHRRCNSLTFSPLFDSLSLTKSLGYNKLHDVPLRLSILKLDGSFFDVQVSSRATVRELKKAVEDVFNFAPLKGFSISWPHVWGNFCLCYRGRKLLVETDYIWRYGIQDGDQLQFIQHHSHNCAPTRRQSMKLFTSFYRRNVSEMVWTSIDIIHSLFTHLTCFLLLSNKYDYREKNEEKDCYDDMENGKFKYHEEKDNNIVEQDVAKWDRFLRRWFPYSGFSTTSAAKSSFGLFESFRRILFTHKQSLFSDGVIERGLISGQVECIR